MYTVIQAVHSLLYIVAKCHFFSVVTWKYIMKYLQKCEGCTHFYQILCMYIYIKECVWSFTKTHPLRYCSYVQQAMALSHQMSCSHAMKNTWQSDKKTDRCWQTRHRRLLLVWNKGSAFKFGHFLRNSTINTILLLRSLQIAIAPRFKRSSLTLYEL